MVNCSIIFFSTLIVSTRSHDYSECRWLINSRLVWFQAIGSLRVEHFVLNWWKYHTGIIMVFKQYLNNRFCLVCFNRVSNNRYVSMERPHARSRKNIKMLYLMLKISTGYFGPSALVLFGADFLLTKQRY